MSDNTEITKYTFNEYLKNNHSDNSVKNIYNFTLFIVTPSPPIICVKEVKHNSAIISIKEPNGSTHSKIIEYKLEYVEVDDVKSSDDDAKLDWSSIGLTAQSHIDHSITSLASSIQYKVRASSKNINGWGSYSSVVLFKTRIPEFKTRIPESISQACEKLCSDNPSFNWFTTKLVDPKVKKADLKMDRIGYGGLNEIKKYLAAQKEHIVFFLFRVKTFDADGSVRSKFIYGRYVGSRVKFMAKAKLTPNLGAIADQFPTKHLSCDYDEEMKDFSPEKLSKGFLRIGGAHKPTKYDYGGGSVYNV
eukprot:39287_1